jgi:uncharacterized protein
MNVAEVAARPVLLIQGGGDGAHAADAGLAAGLREALGPGYTVRFPVMPDEDEPDYAVWRDVILGEVAAMGDGAVLVGHSIGASVLARMLVDAPFPRRVAGAFLASGPFWHEHDFWRWDEAALPPDAAARMPRDLPLFLYHGEADAFVPPAHLEMYAQALPHAVVRRLPGRDHQLNDDMRDIARDIRSLAGA